MIEQAATKKVSISKESARKTLDLFITAYDIDHEKEALLAHYPALINGIRKGRLEIKEVDGDLKVIQRLSKPPGELKEYTYDELEGTNYMALSSKPGEDVYGRIHALLGSLSGLGENAILKLKRDDISLAHAIGMLFLAV